jgi:hypothetical protein
MKFCNLQDIKTTPDDLPDDIAKQLEWLQTLSYKIVDFCWIQPTRADLQIAAMVHSGTADNTRAANACVSAICICNEGEV